MSKSAIQSNSHIASGALLGIFGSVAKSVLVYGYALSISNFGSASLYGLYSLAISIIFILFFVCELGLAVGVVRYISINMTANHLAKVKGIIITAIRYTTIASVLVAIVLFLVRDLLANYYGIPELSDFLAFFAMALPFWVLTNILVFCIQGFKSIKEKVLIRDIAQPLLELALGFGFLYWLGNSYFGIGVAYLLSSVCSAAFAYKALLQRFPTLVDPSVKPELEPDLLSFSRPLMVSRIASVFAFRLPLLAIGIWYTDEMVGYYGAVVQSIQALPLFLAAFSAILAPFITMAIETNDWPQLDRMYKFTTRWIVTLSLPLCLIILFGGESILMLFGDDYVIARIPFVLITLANLVNLLVGPTDTILVMSGYSRLDAINNIAMLLLSLVLAPILIPRFALVGAGLTQMVAIIVVNITKLVQIYKLNHIHPFSSLMLRPLIIAGLTWAILYVILPYIAIFEGHLLNLLGIVSITGIVYFLGVLLFCIVSEDKLVWQEIVNRRFMKQKKLL